MAGEKGIGLLLPALATPEALAAQVNAYNDAVRSPIDQIGAFRNKQCALFSPTFCHEDDATARAIGGPAAMWYLKTVGEIYKDDWQGQSLDEVPDSYRWHAERTRRSGVGGGTIGGNWAETLVPTPSYDGYVESGAFCIGDPARCIDTVRRYRDVGADRLVSVMQLGDIRHEDLMNNIKMFGTHVIPAFR
jgi:alkanesulfonate monooxygenase SsuD/methylene tetrahydromethanopterin reductase-like flavin-dependent oxidoreductase (luciferase family)